MERALLIEAYRWMVLTRTFDQTMVSMWKQGRGVGGTFSGMGHEAISVGSAMALEPDDVAVPMHRDLGTYLVRGMAPERIFGNLLGKTTGPSRGRDANLHGLTDLSLGLIGFISHLPQALPTALGVAMAFRHRRQAQASITFVGDGGTTSGLFHEVLNMAALWKAPLVLIVENNQFAYSTPLLSHTPMPRFHEKAAAYGISGVRIDGNDLEAVYSTVGEALNRARSGLGPTLVEAETMRMQGHAIHDGAEYVPAELLEKWRRKDPIDRLATRLIDHFGVSDEDLAAIHKAAKVAIEEAVAAAEAAPFPDPATLTTGIYAP